MLSKWFSDNRIKVIIGKFHLLVNKTANILYSLQEENLFGNSQGYIQTCNYESKRYGYKAQKVLKVPRN